MDELAKQYRPLFHFCGPLTRGDQYSLEWKHKNKPHTRHCHQTKSSTSGCHRSWQQAIRCVAGECGFCNCQILEVQEEDVAVSKLKCWTKEAPTMHSLSKRSCQVADASATNCAYQVCLVKTKKLVQSALLRVAQYCSTSFRIIIANALLKNISWCSCIVDRHLARSMGKPWESLGMPGKECKCKEICLPFHLQNSSLQNKLKRFLPCGEQKLSKISQKDTKLAPRECIEFGKRLAFCLPKN